MIWAASERLLRNAVAAGGQRLFDEPAAGDAPSFVVETHLVTNSELQLLVAEAEHLGYSPMHGWY